MQKHFNEIKSKNQTLFVSLITASLVASGYLFKDSQTSVIHLSVTWFCNIKSYTLPILAALIFSLAFYILDVGIYHTLLKGAVECGKQFEKNELHIELTSTIIEKHSQDDVTFFCKGAENKLVAFYSFIAVGLIILFIFLNA